MKTMTRIEAIKVFFAQDDGRPVTIAELKVLSADDRKELAEMCAKALDVDLKSAV